MSIDFIYPSSNRPSNILRPVLRSHPFPHHSFSNSFMAQRSVRKKGTQKVCVDDEDRHGEIQKELDNRLGTVKVYLKDVKFKWTRDYIPESKLTELKRSMSRSLKRNDALHRMHGIIRKDVFLKAIPEDIDNDGDVIFRTSEGNDKVLLLDGFLRFRILSELLKNEPDGVWWTVDLYEGISSCLIC